jgi:putative transposase
MQVVPDLLIIGGLAGRIKEYEESGKSSNAIKQHRQLNALKKTEFPWMYEVSKCAPQEALCDLDRAFKNFFREIKKGKNTGFPKFKKKGVNDSFRLTGSIHVFDKSVQLPRIGVVRTKEKTAVLGRILSTTVNREAERWYVSLAVEREREIAQNTRDATVGIDLGLEVFATLSSGQKIPNPQHLKQIFWLLKRRSKQHSRKQKGSKNRKKSALRLACLYRRIRNQRRDFLHKLSSELTKTKSVIVMENLSVKGMVRNKYLSKAISDVGWGKFKEMLEYKSLWYGSRLVTADKFYPSSKLCSRCGCLNRDLKLSNRVFRCSECRLEIDRDLNSALNLLKLATASSAGSYACQDTSGGGTSLRESRTVYEPCVVEAGSRHQIS